MHELSIALSLVDLVEEQAPRLGNVRIEALHLRIGPLSGVAPEALSFAFAEARRGTILEAARLSIEPADGRELELVSVEVSDVGPDR